MSRVVVVTGGTRGIGLAMCEAFLKRGCKVSFCGRDEAQVGQVEADFAARLGRENILGTRCDVGRYEDLVALWGRTVARFGRVDLWVNNAGTSSAQVPFVEQPGATLGAVVQTNLLGTMYGSRVALEGMLAQGHGALYNMEGFGSDGARQLGMSSYGSTKVAVRYLTRSIASELRGTPVLVCTISPGVVVTELLTSVYEQGDPARWARTRRLFNFIADTAETVAPWLVDAMLANTKSDVRLAWMTYPKAIGRFFLPKYHRRDLFRKG